MEGNPKDVHMEYLNYMNEERIDRLERERTENQIREMQERKEKEEQEKRKNQKRYGSEDAKFTNIRMIDIDGKEQSTFKTGDTMILDLDYHVEKSVVDAVFGFGIFRNDGLWCYGTNTRIDRMDNFDIEKDGNFKVTISDLNLIPGQYWCDITIEFGEGNPVDYYKQAMKFEVVSNVADVGVSRLPHKWELNI